MREQEWLRWQCRRGMLELDVILMPFLEQQWSRLLPGQQEAFVRLLEQSDLQLFRWLMRGEVPEQPEFRALIEVIRDSHQTRTAS
ncbi:succinate dehydrogenase assembly factor 2 [Pseudaeromonas sharmana]|uniref:FAD assembly factor SdhE n=1 Tax=Pseudaeromonas sharmana TaxID=328412 RepID=A0ABV8CMD2_9GAMM